MMSTDEKYRMGKGVYVDKIDDLPMGEHWAILRSTGVHIPGDERSRTNPGHGYPEHTDMYMEYVAFTSKTAFEEELKRRYKAENDYNRNTFIGIHVAGMVKEQAVIILEEKK